jgi:hypothetical protein
VGLSRVGQVSGITSATLPAHQAGDVIIAFAFRDGSTTQPTLPSGWTSIGTRSGTSCCGRAAWKRCASSSETSGTWTNASSVLFIIFRGALASGTPVGGNASQAGTTASVTYPAATMTAADGTSWVIGLAGHRSVDTSLETAPTGMTNVIDYLDSTCEAAGHDTEAGVSSWSAQSVSVGGTASGWVTFSIELMADQSSSTWTKVASVVSITSPTVAYVDLSAIDIQEGDVLAVHVGVWTDGVSVSSIRDKDDASNPCTRVANETVNPSNIFGYVLAAAAKSASIIRVALSGAASDGVAIELYQFRLSSGYTASLDQDPAVASGSSTTATSGSITTGGADALVVCAASVAAGVSSFATEKIAGLPAAGYSRQSYGSYYSDYWYSTFAEAKSSINGQVTLGSSDSWSARIISFRATASDQSLTASEIASGAPAMDSPALSQSQALAAQAVAAGSPTLGSPIVGQVQALTASTIASGAPIASSPAISQSQSLEAQAVAAGAPSATSPVLAQTQALLTGEISAGAPVMAAPAVDQTQALASGEISAGAVVLGEPSLSQEQALVANPIAAGAPEATSPGLSLVQGMEASPIAAGTPETTLPEVGQVQDLEAQAIATGEPTAGAPALTQGQAVDFVADPISTLAPTAEAPEVSQVQGLVADDIAAGAVVIGTPGLNEHHVIPGADYIVTVGPEHRVLEVAAESRRAIASGEERSIRIVAEARRLTVAAESRRVVVAAESRIVAVEA